MEDKERAFLEHWSHVLKNFLSPLVVCEKIEDFGGVHGQLCNESNAGKHFEIFEQSLFNSDSSSIFQDFKEALKNCPDQKWLYDFMFEPESLGSLAEYIHHVENIEAIKRVLHKLKPELHYIDGREFIQLLQNYFSEDEWHEIDAVLKARGNIHGLWKIFSILPRKEKAWIKEMYEFVKERRLRTTSGGIIAEALQEYFDVGYDDDFNNVQAIQAQLDENVEQCEKVEGGLVENLHGEDPSNIVPYFQTMNPDVSTADKEQEETPQKPSCSGIQLPRTLSPVPEDDKQNVATNEEQKAESETEFKLRGYQEELVNCALNGGNCIICAPPGSGKTLIATHIILRLLNKYPGCRVLFFAPSVALVNQHKQRLSTYLGGRYEIGCIHGRSENGDDLRVSKLQIICLTPQICVNNIVKTASLKEKNLKVLLTNFKCLIFDECHHCQNKEPYGNLMRLYMESKNSANTEEVPQVIGLTATLGVGPSIEMESIKENIKQLCANLDAYEGIKTVSGRNVDELNSYISHPEEEIIKLDERQADHFTICLETFMDSLLCKLEEFGVFHSFKEGNRNRTCKDFKMLVKKSMDFYHSCERLLNCIILSHFTQKRDAIACLQYLTKCHRALTFHAHCDASDGLNVLKKFLEETAAKSGEEENKTETEVFIRLSELTRQLDAIIQENDLSNSNLLRIKVKIDEAIANDPNSRIMVLVTERKYTEAIKRWMLTVESLKPLDPEMFVGIVKSRKDGLKMDAEKQRQILDAFGRGVHKVLVCTVGAAGEGLDIVDCNLVITYNCLQNEISLVQTRGRVRKIGGLMIKMYNSNKSLLHDRLSSYKEILMRKATTEVQKEISEDMEKYLADIKLMQNENEIEFQLWCSKLAKDMENKTLDKEYHVLCKVCSAFAFTSSDIRRSACGQVDTMTQVARATGQIININPVFRENFSYRDHPRKKYMGPGWEKKHKIQCKKCGNDWGLEACWKSLIDFPFPKMAGFLIIDPDNPDNFMMPRNWSAACFQIPVINLETVLEAVNQEKSDN